MFSISPTNGTTYYYKPNDAVYRLEIVLENCHIVEAYRSRFLTVTSKSKVSKITLESDEGYSVPSSAAATGGVTLNSTKPTKIQIQMKPALSNCFYLENIDVTGITEDATITVTAVQQ